uniref:Trans-1,2-dihydrobenzene-1,2-diol dehydrogenase n=1 Tax=Riptortus pedestris TaxID=329032 RepID=R4WQZ0_RIPPE|nr:dimeric dihydrodiol dehydrogenase [Riptortus pedestris]
MATRWGIVSAGKISNDFVTALENLPRSEHEVIAVAAKDKERAADFAKQHNIPKAYGSYEELAADKSIEVVYIGAITSWHYPLAKLMLESGKHILCEKALCTNYKHTEKLVSLAREKKLFLMEAVWSRCFPLYDELRKLLAEKVIGDVLYVRVDFGLQISDIPRIKKIELGGGTILDLGVYALQLTTLILGNKPLSVNATGNLNEEGIDENADYILKYPNGVTANLATHSRVKLDNAAAIYGTKGCIKIKEPFWCPTVLVVNDEEKVFPLPFKSNKLNFSNSEGLLYEAVEVRNCIKKRFN